MVTLKVDHISDLHLPHYVRSRTNRKLWEIDTKRWAKELLAWGEGDVLLLAGDFSEWNEQALWFLQQAAEQYRNVLFVTGNHDRYLVSQSQRDKYWTSSRRVQELYEQAAALPGVTPMERAVVTIDGFRIAGDGLWYRPQTPEDFGFYTGNSNDSFYIFEGVPMLGTPEYLYQEAMAWYNTLRDEPLDLMLSHVPPLHPPLSTYPRNACFDCPVDFLAAPVWVCGHQHVQGTFEKAGTTFHMNALGYPSELLAPKLRSFTLHKQEG